MHTVQISGKLLMLAHMYRTRCVILPGGRASYERCIDPVIVDRLIGCELETASFRP